jgi:hypothetical protein
MRDNTVAQGLWETMPGLVQRLMELHALAGVQQMSMAAIAGKLSREFNVTISKNAVIGKSRRLRLPPRPQGATILTRKPEPKRVRKVHIAPIAPPIAPRCEGAGLTIYQLRDGDCHWPLGATEDRPPFAYCGEPSDIGRPYCVTHYQRGHIAPRKVWE